MSSSQTVIVLETQTQTPKNNDSDQNINDNEGRHDDPRAAFFLTYSGYGSTIVFAMQITFAAWVAKRWNVPRGDVIFSLGFSAYLHLANSLRFDSNRPAIKRHNNNVDISLLNGDEKEYWFKQYMIAFTLVGVVLPFGTMVFGPDRVANLTAPHFFVLWMQIVMESAMMHDVKCYDLIRLLIPIGFSAYRQTCLMTWFTEALVLPMNDGDVQDDKIEPGWYYWIVGLSLCNLIAWTYNLFVTLLLRMLPTFMDTEKSPLPDNIKWKYHLIPVLDTVCGENDQYRAQTNHKKMT
jgi:hypothetical protein